MTSKNHLERILYIDNSIRQGNYPSKSVFTDRFEVSAKTIERDLQYMRDRLGAPLEYDKIRKGYFYSSNNYFLPSTVMNEGELFALILSMETIKAIGDPLLTDRLMDSYKKLAKYLPENVKVDLDSLAEHSILVAPRGPVINQNIWRVITDAVKLRKKIKIIYQSPGKDGTVERELLPYYLLSSKGGWYILALNKTRNRIETYAVFRMKKAELLNANFTIPHSFSPDDYIDPEFGIYSRTEEYDIVIEFNTRTAPYIKERIWHKGQKIIENEDGSIILKFKTNQLESVQFWLLPWGDGPKVIEPPLLRDMMEEVIEDMRVRYRN